MQDGKGVHFLRPFINVSKNDMRRSVLLEMLFLQLY